MKKLYIDDFVRNKGFDSTEDYIQSFTNEFAFPSFNSVKYFKSLYSAGLIKEGMIIRTSDMGNIDEHYRVNNEGNLVGITDTPSTYPGKQGTFKPEQILKGKRISDSWNISSGKFKYLFGIWNKNK